jgi:Transmembrane domain of unknown function (DUF3566)
MRLAGRAGILGITSTQETRSEEDGVENRSEPQGWLTDGSPDSAGRAQDADQAAGVKTAVSAPDSSTPKTSTPDTPAADADADASQAKAEHPAPFEPSTAAFTSPSWDTESATYENGSSYSSNGGDTPGAASPSGAAAPASWSAPAADTVPPAPGAGAANGFSSSPAASGSPAAASYTAPQAPPAAFPSPPPSRPRPARPGKAQRPQSRPAAQRPGPAAGAASTRKAQLAVSRIEPWSVMKFSFMISLVGWVILFVVVAIMYFVLQKLGVFHSIETTVGLVTASKNHAGTDAASWFSASRVLGYTMLVGAVNVILITALATVGSVLYNLVTMLAGGIEVTLKETD